MPDLNCIPPNQYDQASALLRGMVIAVIDEVKNSDSSTDINDSIEGVNEKRQGKRKIGWSQAIYPLWARLQELKSHFLSEKWDEVLEDEFMELKSGKQAFMDTQPKLIRKICGRTIKP